MSRIGLSFSQLKVCAYFLAFVTPIAGALTLMVSLLKIVLSTKGKHFITTEFYTVIFCIVVGVLLVASGFILLVGLIKEKIKWIFLYLVLSTPSLVYLMCEAVFIAFLEWHFKIAMIVFVILMLCAQLCVVWLMVIIIRKKRNRSLLNLVIYYENNGYFNTSFSDDSSFDSLSSL